MSAMPAASRVSAGRAALVLLVFLGLHLAAAYAGRACLWGADALAYLPTWATPLFVAGILVLLAPGPRRRLAAAWGWLSDSSGPAPTVRSRFLRAFGFAAVGAAAFVLLRSATPLLGDGQLHLHDLRLVAARNGILPQAAWANNNAPLSYWLIHGLHRSLAGLVDSPESTFRLVSWISGIFYLLLCLPVTRALTSDRAERGVALALLGSAGYLQLFCGYFEVYALAFPLLVAYLIVCLRALRGSGSLVPAGVLLGVLVPLHLSLATLAPSLLVLAAGRARARIPRGAAPGSRPVPKRLEIAVALIAAPLLALLLFRLIGFDVFLYLREARGSHFLPLFEEAGFLQAYRFLSPAHLLDAFNELLLVAPGLVLTLGLLRRGGEPFEAMDAFLATATIVPWVFTFAANPEIGAFRDWDALALPALPGTLWAARLLARRTSGRAALSGLGVMVAGAAALHTWAWVGVNADPARSEARFTTLLTECRLSTHARSYGWESLGTYRRQHDRFDAAASAYREAVAINPDNPRLHSMTGETLCAAERFAAAVPYFEKAIALNPDLPEPYFLLGNVLVSLGQDQRAVERYREALARGLDDANVHYNLGLALYRRQEYEAAVASFRQAIVQRPDFVLAHFNLGAAYGKLGQAAQARACALEVLRLDPYGPQAAAVRAWLDRTP